jgi:hypothetical protein
LALAEYCPSLSTIRLAWCHEITDESIGSGKVVGTGAQSVGDERDDDDERDDKIADGPIGSEAVAETTAQSVGDERDEKPGLEASPDQAHVKTIDLKTKRGLAECCADLARIDLSGCEKLTIKVRICIDMDFSVLSRNSSKLPQAIESLRKNCPLLHEANLMGCNLISKKDKEDLQARFDQLSVSDIHMCTIAQGFYRWYVCTAKGGGAALSVGCGAAAICRFLPIHHI